MAISDWPEGERPREKLLSQGVKQLSDAELLAIFLRIGVRGKSAVDLARELLNHFGSLNAIFSANRAEITQVNGVGDSKYCQLQAIFEMSQRAMSESLKTGDAMGSPDVVRAYLKMVLKPLTHEVFMVLFLDTQNRVTAHEVLFEGTLNEAAVYPREVVKKVIAHHAAAIILAHNHPSGFAKPSESDIAITAKLKQAMALIDVNVLDHLIVADQAIYSFAEAGKM